MKRFDLKKQRRKERRNDKALEEFSRSTATEREATITIGNRQVKGVLRKKGPSSLEFTERLAAGIERKPLQLVLTQRDNFFQYAESKVNDEGLELTSSSEGAMTLDADTAITSPDASAQAVEREGHDEPE